MKKAWIVLIVILLLAGFLAGCGNNNGNSELLILKNGETISENRCMGLDNYFVIYETGCPHCGKVLPRLDQVEEDLGIEVIRYNLVVQEDFEKITQIWKILPEGVPAVVINCKIYLGSGYSIDDYKDAIQGN